MGLFWRLVLSAVLMGGMAIWLPHAVSTEAARANAPLDSVYGPLAQDNDNAEDNFDNFDNTDNDNIETDNDNIETDNDNDVPPRDDNDNDPGGVSDNDNVNNNGNDNDGNTGTVPTDPSQVGAQVSNSDLVVDLWRSMDHPYQNNPFMIAVKGSGAPIDRVWWWAEGPGNYTNGDDLALQGQVSHSCGGANPCEQNWTVVPRSVGTYFIHARVRDTSGREVETVWQIFISSNPR